MKLNIFSHLSSEPFIPHMRIAWQDGIRKQTEEYWRAKITAEIYSDAYMQGYYDGATRSGKYHDDLVEWIGDDLL